MNRPIKFRAWDKASRSMTPWSEIVDHWTFEYTADELSEFLQFVGSKDRNDVEIYEGDILEYRPDFKEEDDAVELYLVKWHKNGFVAAWRGDLELKNRDNDGLINAGKDMAVVGNRYENPDLFAEVTS